MDNLGLAPEMLILVAVAAVGGLLGGVISARRGGLIGSILMGTIGGLVVALLAAVANLPPLIEVAGYSLVYALAGGVLLSFIIGYSSK